MTYVETLVEFLLLLVYYAETEVDLVGFFKIGLHAHDLRESFLGVLQRAIPIVQYANAIPKLGFLVELSEMRAREMGKGVLP